MALYDEKVREAVRKFPDSPGVYVMRNSRREIIYIGKAASLKKRVGSYFNRALNPKTELLVAEIKNIDFRITDSAMEALILEANLIKLYKPHYNIRLKDDKYFVNIVITDEEYPRVLIVRATDKHKPRRNMFSAPIPLNICRPGY
jgi:excinuclease ABC subunit C